MEVRDMLPSWYPGAKMVHFGGFRQGALSEGTAVLASRAKVTWLIAELLSCLAAIWAAA